MSTGAGSNITKLIPGHHILKGASWKVDIVTRQDAFTAVAVDAANVCLR